MFAEHDGVTLTKECHPGQRGAERGRCTGPGCVGGVNCCSGGSKYTG